MKMIDNYKDLPVGKYCDIQKAVKEGGEEIDTQIKIIAILSDLTEREVSDLPITEYRERAIKAEFLQHPIQNPPKPAKCYKIGGFELILKADPAKMTTAQYIDFQTLSPNIDENIVELVSIVLVPKGHNYGGDYDLAEVQKAIRENLSVADVIGISAFFLKRLAKSMLRTRTYLTNLIRRNPRLKEAMTEYLTRKAVQTNGGGLPS